VQSTSNIPGSLLVAAGLFVSASQSNSQSTVSTPILGFFNLSLLEGKASLISLPLNQASIVLGKFFGKSGAVLSTSASLSSLPTTLANSDNVPLYYIEVTSGPCSGLLLELLSKGSTSLTISSADASQLTGSESFQIKKFATLSDVFGSINPAGLLGGDSPTTADVVWAVTNGSWRQYFFYNDGFNGETDPRQWETPGSSVYKGDSRIDPDQGVHVVRKPGSNRTVTITGQVKATPSFVPFTNGSQIITNPYPVDKTLETLGLKTGNSSTGLLEGNSLNNSDIVYKLENGDRKQYFVYNEGFSGEIDPIQWQTPGSYGNQGNVTVSTGEALLIVRRGSQFSWNVSGS
jgi:uncharacterized protein (TIGR02597 family)